MTFRDLPIRRKVTRVVLLSTTVALLLTISALALYDLVTFRNALVLNLTTISGLVAWKSCRRGTSQRTATVT